MKYQYIGDDNDPPQSTTFMGKYKFSLRSKYVDVTDPVCLAKLKNHSCFKQKVENQKVENQKTESPKFEKPKFQSQKADKKNLYK